MCNHDIVVDLGLCTHKKGPEFQLNSSSFTILFIECSSNKIVFAVFFFMFHRTEHVQHAFVQFAKSDRLSEF